MWEPPQIRERVIEMPVLEWENMSTEEIRAATDEHLFAVLSGEGGKMVPEALANGINAELFRRQFERSRKPHWTTTPGFVIAIITLLLTAVAAVASVLALPQVQQLVAPAHQAPPAGPQPPRPEPPAQSTSKTQSQH